MQVRKAAQALGLDPANMTESDIRSAAAEALRAAHPDNGGDIALASSQISRAKEARETLLRHLETGGVFGMKDCPACAGKGTLPVRGKFKAPDCPRCRGTGQISI